MPYLRKMASMVRYLLKIEPVNNGINHVNKTDLFHEISGHIRDTALACFRRYCCETNTLPADLYNAITKILKGEQELALLYPYFLRYLDEIYPHLKYMDTLKLASDLCEPAKWYAAARSRKRRIIFHGGPTNSGKTYQAMQRFLNAESGIYCSPLKLLAVEVSKKSNDHVSST